MPGVTISSAYGAGGTTVAARVAESLGLTMVDRAITSQVAEALHVSDDEAQSGSVRRGFVERFFGVLAPMTGIAIGPEGPESVREMLPAQEPGAFRVEADRVIHEAMARGAVVVGRGGAAALADGTDVLRVRLFGPVEARIAQAVVVDGIDEALARDRQPQVDRARSVYVERLYGRDIDDPLLYHLQLDSTTVPLQTCAEIIVTAYRGSVPG